MMRGYDKDEAIAFICAHIREKDHPLFKGRIPELISQIIDADMTFMHNTNVIDENGDAGDNYYEEDDAFEFMVEELVKANRFSPEEAVKVASLIDDYTDYQEEYLESKGLVDWE